ncbi:hypothetical protein, partial [Streptomyces sp. NPDC051001]|uniref:hypothetical protein n=1 Tax=Streptomyces sp. NPDC051001 TaxID=3155795 RepID=UPI00343D8ED7
MLQGEFAWGELVSGTSGGQPSPYGPEGLSRSPRATPDPVGTPQPTAGAHRRTAIRECRTRQWTYRDDRRARADPYGNTAADRDPQRHAIAALPATPRRGATNLALDMPGRPE